ncbi:MAG: MFS transporter, partial [Micromonosporaceae bacterium]
MTAVRSGVPALPEPAVDPLSEPTGKAPKRWTVAFSLATVATFVGWYGPLQILLAQQAETVSPGHKEAVLGLVAGVGAACSMLANPLWGALSDRTTSRYGRRIPYVLGGAVAGAASLLLLGSADSVALMVVGWCLVQIALNAPFAALSAAVPDQVPVADRGAGGAWFGVAQTVGVMAGTGIATAAGGTTAGYAACAGFVLVASLPYVLLRRDRVLPRKRRPRWRTGGFWISPRRHPDFAWAWLTRFLMNLGNAIALLYLFFFLKYAVRLPDPEAGVFLLTVLNAGFLLVTVLVGGYWSDRVGRRRGFVCGAGVVMAVAAFILAFWQTWPGAIVAAIVLGIGFGAYTSVDFALITLVLPAAADRGRDLGVINVANTLPQVLAPVLAAPLVVAVGGHLAAVTGFEKTFSGYAVLYLVAGVVGLVGAV